MSGEAGRGYATNADPAKLFVPARPDSDREGILSRYLEFEFHRFKLGQSFNIEGGLVERLKILHWYLAGYGPHRKLPLPLSRQQIAFLNGPLPIIGLGPELSVAAYSFIRLELGRHHDLTNADIVREVLYWWCVQRSIQFAPGGELATPEQIRAVSHAGPEETGRYFPLNYYARRSQELDPTLTHLNLNRATDRAVLSCILALRCAAHPYLTQFLPRPAMSELLAIKQAETSPTIDRLLGLALKGSGDDEDLSLADAREIRSLVEDRLKRNGFSLSRSAAFARTPKPGAGLCFTDDLEIAPGLDPGVAVIGPTRAASGLGQATRLSLDVLDHAGLKPAALDFGLDNPAPVGFASVVNAPKLKKPRAINLIHLNAESIPLAFAYINSSVYERSYNIGYFFWELNQIPKCHHLALDMLDEIWVSSEYNREIYERFADIPVRNVGMAVEPLPEAEPCPRERFGIAPDEFVFLATFDSFSFIERKNPLAVLRAFQQAFPVSSQEGVGLILKTQNRTRVRDPHQVRIWDTIDEIVAHDFRIRVVDETFSYREVLGFKKACDCYVSLHRSEGWGFGLIEAMQLRLPLIATAYSGNMDFCRPENSYLVDFELVPPTPAEYIFVERGSLWADPSIETAAAHMREVYANPDAARAKAAVAAADIEQRFGVPSIAERYKSRLDEVRRLLPAGED